MNRRDDVAEAVIADYRDGHPITAICTEHGCSRATVHRIAKAAGLPGRKRGPAKRPTVYCACGTPTTSKTRTCRFCYLTTVVASDPADEADAELVGGSWVLDRRALIMRWEAA